MAINGRKALLDVSKLSVMSIFNIHYVTEKQKQIEEPGRHSA